MNWDLIGGIVGLIWLIVGPLNFTFCFIMWAQPEDSFPSAKQRADAKDTVRMLLFSLAVTVIGGAGFLIYMYSGPWAVPTQNTNFG